MDVSDDNSPIKMLQNGRFDDMCSKNDDVTDSLGRCPAMDDSLNAEFDSLGHKRSSSSGDAQGRLLAAKNDSFLSLSTGSDLFQDDPTIMQTAQRSSTSRGMHCSGSSLHPDDAESGRFTEQESMDLTHDFANHEEESASEKDSESDVVEHLRAELEKAKKELRVKNEKCEKLSEMQNIVDAEIHELTASLFQEAYKMVSEANQKRHTAEKLYKEAHGKVEMLEAEVEALKALVLTSTPSAPNKHLHPQLLAVTKKPPLSFFNSKNRTSNSPGHKRNLSDTVTSSATATTAQDTSPELQVSAQTSPPRETAQEVDPNYFREFTCWREKMDPRNGAHVFLKRIYAEEIAPCMNFPNEELAQQVLHAIEENTVFIERICGEKPVISRTCALLDVPSVCSYRLKLDATTSDSIFISTLCRNRIAAVCDFFTYLRYMHQGLVKCGIRECYWEIIRLRKNMNMARLGLGFSH